MPLLAAALAFATSWTTVNVTVVQSPGFQPVEAVVRAEPAGHTGAQPSKEATMRAKDGHAPLSLDRRLDLARRLARSVVLAYPGVCPARNCWTPHGSHPSALATRDDHR